MADFRSPADDRDESAADRDDAARSRDAASSDREAVADRRDADADARDLFSGELVADFDVRLAHLGQDLLDRFARNENNAIDPRDYPDTGPAVLARLRAHATEQRRLAALDRTAALTMLDEIHNELRLLQGERRAAAQDRHAAARDRAGAADDRHAAARDRDRAMRDRNQSAIERELPDPAEFARSDDVRPTDVEGLTGDTSARIARARQTILDSRTLLAGTHGSATEDRASRPDG